MYNVKCTMSNCGKDLRIRRNLGSNMDAIRHFQHNPAQFNHSSLINSDLAGATAPVIACTKTGHLGNFNYPTKK